MMFADYGVTLEMRLDKAMLIVAALKLLLEERGDPLDLQPTVDDMKASIDTAYEIIVHDNA